MFLAINGVAGRGIAALTCIVLVALTAPGCDKSRRATAPRDTGPRRAATKTKQAGRPRAPGKTPSPPAPRRELPPRRCKNPFVPRWSVGQTWRVAYTFYFRGPPLGNPTHEYGYKVLGLEEIDGRLTYKLKRLYSGTFDGYFYIDADTFTLRADDKLKDRERIATSRPYMVQIAWNLYAIMYDFGAFCSAVPEWSSQKKHQKERKRLARKFGLQLAGDAIVTEVLKTPCHRCVHEIDTAYIQEISFAAVKGAMRVRLMEPVADCGSEGIRWTISEQVWERGKPWWSRARRTRCGGAVDAEGRLLDR